MILISNNGFKKRVVYIFINRIVFIELLDVQIFDDIREGIIQNFSSFPVRFYDHVLFNQSYLFIIFNFGG